MEYLLGLLGVGACCGLPILAVLGLKLSGKFSKKNDDDKVKDEHQNTKQSNLP
jgi:hypothetical protein